MEFEVVHAGILGDMAEFVNFGGELDDEDRRWREVGDEGRLRPQAKDVGEESSSSEFGDAGRRSATSWGQMTAPSNRERSSLSQRTNRQTSDVRRVESDRGAVTVRIGAGRNAVGRPTRIFEDRRIRVVTRRFTTGCRKNHP